MHMRRGDRRGPAGRPVGGNGVAPSFLPTQVSGLLLWLRGDRGIVLNGSRVSEWQDQSGGARHFSIGVELQQPLYNSSPINGKPTLEFDGVNSRLAGPSFSAQTAAEGFAVFRLVNDPPTLGSGGFWDFGVSTSAAHVPFTDGIIYDEFGSTVRKTTVNPTPSLTSPRVYSVVSITNEWTSYIDGNQLFTTATNAVGFATSTLVGASNNIGTILPMHGSLAEVIIYNKKLSAEERSRVLRYVGQRYGIVVP